MPTPPTTWPKRLRSIRRREARRQSATHAVEAGGRTYPLSPLRGVEWPGRMVDFARLIHRPVRVLGGPAVPAACGGNQMPTHSARQGMPADWGAYDPAGCGTTAAALGRQAAGRLAVACASDAVRATPLRCKSNPQGDRAADRSRNFALMGSDYPLPRSSILNIGSSHVQTGVVRAEEEGRGSSLVRHLLCLIGVSRSGGGVQSRWPNRWRRTTRAKRLVRGIAVFVLCASLLVACGGGGGGGGYGGGGGPTTTVTTGTTTTGTTTTSTTGMTTTTT
jgi:hypothetical protein